MDEGLVHRLDAVNAWSACHDAGGAPHDLLVVCTGCGAVAELSDPAMSRQLAERVAQTGFTLATHETEIRALCPQCRSSPPTPATTTTGTEHRPAGAATGRTIRPFILQSASTNSRRVHRTGFPNAAARAAPPVRSGAGCRRRSGWVSEAPQAPVNLPMTSPTLETGQTAPK